MILRPSLNYGTDRGVRRLVFALARPDRTNALHVDLRTRRFDRGIDFSVAWFGLRRPAGPNSEADDG